MASSKARWALSIASLAPQPLSSSTPTSPITTTPARYITRNLFRITPLYAKPDHREASEDRDLVDRGLHIWWEYWSDAIRGGPAPVSGERVVDRVHRLPRGQTNRSTCLKSDPVVQ